MHGRELIHGEGVALGSLINAYLYQWGLAETKARLDRCRVRYRPDEIGCSVAEIRETMERINELNDKLGRGRNWFHLHRLDDQTFERMMAAIES